MYQVVVKRAQKITKKKITTEESLTCEYSIDELMWRFELVEQTIECTVEQSDE